MESLARIPHGLSGFQRGMKNWRRSPVERAVKLSCRWKEGPTEDAGPFRVRGFVSTISGVYLLGKIVCFVVGAGNIYSPQKYTPVAKMITGAGGGSTHSHIGLEASSPFSSSEDFRVRVAERLSVLARHPGHQRGRVDERIMAVSAKGGRRAERMTVVSLISVTGNPLDLETKSLAVVIAIHLVCVLPTFPPRRRSDRKVHSRSPQEAFSRATCQESLRASGG